MVRSATDIVAAHIAERYANPGRFAYTYLFRLRPDSDFGPLVPEVDSILAAWMDEGGGLQTVPAELAVEHCQATRAQAPDLRRPQPLNKHQRRQMMARSILFTAVQAGDDLVQVRLMSRSLVFSPKGDREAFEDWRPTGEDWYSAYRARLQDEEDNLTDG
jgi:hypothetical protein